MRLMPLFPSRQTPQQSQASLPPKAQAAAKMMAMSREEVDALFERGRASAALPAARSPQAAPPPVPTQTAVAAPDNGPGVQGSGAAEQETSPSAENLLLKALGVPAPAGDASVPGGAAAPATGSTAILPSPAMPPPPPSGRLAPEAWPQPATSENVASLLGSFAWLDGAASGQLKSMQPQHALAILWDLDAKGGLQGRPAVQVVGEAAQALAQAERFAAAGMMPFLLRVAPSLPVTHVPRPCQPSASVMLPPGFQSPFAFTAPMMM